MDNFSELLVNSEGEKHLILGNGFGIAYDEAFGERSFSWTTLLDLCEIEEGSRLHSLINECNYDFELAHQKLNDAISLINNYSPGNELIDTLKAEVQSLREQLTVAVASSHPDSFNIDFTSPKGIEIKRKILSCRSFLVKFNNIFSLNYDLLLYWVRCFESDYLGHDSFGREDGELSFVEDDKADFLFPHGALFIFRDGVGAKKCSSSKGKPIIARVKENISNGIFPMCISEGTGEQKLNCIKNNSYLLFAYKKIKECKNTIFTFGCSFKDGKDSHIIKAMLNSRADKIIVGVHSPSAAELKRINHVFESAKEELGSDVEIIVANTSETEIWKP